MAYSVMSTQARNVLHEVRGIRREFGNDVILVAGGPHASARPLELLKGGFDYVVVGEGERALPDLVWKLTAGKSVIDVPGLVTHQSDVIPTPRDIPKVHLDDYPPFALGMNVVGPIEVTRGCPFTCKFCCTPFLTGGHVRHRSVDVIVHWLERAVRERGFRRAWFLSPNALCYGGRGREVRIDRLESLLRRARSIPGLDEVYFGSFPSEVRPEFVGHDVLGLLREYVANKTLQIGVQSGSDRVLEFANRHHTVEDGMNAVNVALENGFIPHVDMIFGLPSETEGDLHSSIDLCIDLAEMGAKIHGHAFMPLPGSAFENMPPGRLDVESRKRLGELSRKGILTGSWTAQERIAADLASKP